MIFQNRDLGGQRPLPVRDNHNLRHYQGKAFDTIRLIPHIYKFP